MKITEIGYFGRTTNVSDPGVDATIIDAFAAAIAALPRRKPSATIVTLPIARDPRGRPLRFISVAHLQPGDF